jgi:hypothetical protein
MGIVRENDGVVAQVRFNSPELSGLVVVRVQAVVKEYIHIPQAGKHISGITRAAINDLRPWLSDEVPGLWINIDRCKPAMLIAEQSCGNDAGPQAEVCAGLDDMIGLQGTHEGIPSQPARPVRLLGRYAPARS